MSRLQNLFLAAALLACTGTVVAQTELNVVHTDTVRLVAAPHDGTLQWQVSDDQIDWQDMPNATTSPYDAVITSVPQYFRGLITQEGCAPYYSETLAVISSPLSYYWSDPNAWGGAVPVVGQDVIIPIDRRIILDVSPPPLGSLTIIGTLEFLEEDLTLISDWIMVHGTLQVGTESEPFTHNAIITLTDDDMEEDIMGMGTRGIMVMGGRLELHGTPPDVTWTKINAHAPAGSTSLQLIENVDWVANDQIVVAPTDYYLAGNNASVSQPIVLTAAAGNALTLATGLNAHRWGLLQYATTNGMSLSPTNLLTPPVADTDSTTTPLILDERAEVGHLTRNIVIQAPDDALWQDNGFGVHVMIMGQGAEAHLNGVEIRRGGQRGMLGRYPFHWHMLSYSGTQTLEDATGQYFRNSVVNESANRGVVIHGTNGVEVSRNVIFDIEGHGIFTEDAVERRNLIDGNLVLRIRNPNMNPQDALKQHEATQSSGFWLSNPDNIITNNVAADCGAFGYWLAFPSNPWGESQSVLDTDGLLLNPSRILFGTFDNNTAHSNGNVGIMLDNPEIDNAGNTYPNRYESTIDGNDVEWPFLNLRRFTLSRYKTWKNRSNGIWDRARWATNFEVVSADNCGRFFAGAGDDGIIERSLVIGTSLNFMMNGTGRPTFADFQSGWSSSNPAAFATYHSTFDIRNNIAIDFQPVEDQRSGVFSTDDYYIRAVDKGHYRNTNNLIQNSHAGVKLYAPYAHMTFAGALWDPQGIWGPVNNYFVYDTPFLTYGQTITQVAPSTAVSGGVSVPGPFFGFGGFVLHGVGNTPPQSSQYYPLMGIHIRRLDAALNEVGTWTVPTAQNGAILANMRHFATNPNGMYELTFPDETIAPTIFQMDVENMLTESDVQVIGIQYDGTLDPIVAMRVNNTQYPYTELNSLQEVIASAGETYWQDNANNRVWIKLRGGRWQFWTTDPTQAVPTSDDLLYEGTIIRVYEP
jgi:hypothetical protein